MPNRHRNSQKRIYEEGAQYFITSVTFDRYPYFKNPILAELFVCDLWFAAELKEFNLYGYTVQHDHVHLLFQPRGAANYSEIMRSLKTNFSRNANDIILNRAKQILIAGDVTSHRLRMYQQHYLNVVKPLYQRFLAQSPRDRQIPTFHWQSSFRDHIIRDENDYLNHLEYIHVNAVKHGVVREPEQFPWMWVEGMPRPFLPD